jgi:hypothetical protein
MTVYRGSGGPSSTDRDLIPVFDPRQDGELPYFTKATLREANAESEALGLNRGMDNQTLALLLASHPDTQRYPITQAFLHYRGGDELQPRDTEPQVRCRVILDVDAAGEPVAGMVDLTRERYGRLPRRKNPLLETEGHRG